MACPRWRTLQELGRSGVERGVGEEDVVPHAFVLVEERKLGSGVGAFPADDDASVGRIAGKVGHAGQFRDLGGLARSPSWPSLDLRNTHDVGVARTVGGKRLDSALRQRFLER